MPVRRCSRDAQVAADLGDIVGGQSLGKVTELGRHTGQSVGQVEGELDKVTAGPTPEQGVVLGLADRRG